ncbi:MAG: hypothetical protein ACI8PZ_000001, partial [Myxococcota bacterium]
MRVLVLPWLLAACATSPSDKRPGDTGAASTDPSTTTPAGTTPAGSTPTGSTPAGTTPTGTTPTGTTPTGTTPTGTTPTGTTSTDPFEPEVDDEDAGSPGDPSDALFDDTVIHEVAITLSDDAAAALLDDGYTYVPGAVTVDGLSLALVGVRLRGKLGSYRELDEKPKFKVDFNQYIPGQRLWGVETLTLNNSVADCSFMVEALGYYMFDQLGVTASRLSFAHVTVNDLDYGLYQLVETQDDRYLAHHFTDTSGNLYDGKYVYDGGWSADTLDFVPEQWPLFQLEEGVDVGNEDVRLLTEAIRSSRRTPEFYATTGAFVDWPILHKFLAGEHWLDQWDGYALNQNNYRFYFNPETGLAELLPFDLDLAMGGGFFFFSWSSPAGELAAECFDDPTCSAEHQAAVAAALDTLAAADIEARLTAWDALTLEAAMSDPRKECSNIGVTNARRDLFRNANGRDAELRDFWR